MKIADEIRAALFDLQDTEYRAFVRKLIPTIDPQTVIGVRTPALRKLAKTLAQREDADLFLNDLPHGFFEENQLHAFIVSEIRDYGACLEALERFLPYVDNWATCDQMSPKVFKKHRQALLAPIQAWLTSEKPFTVRFGIGMLMEHYLDDCFDPAYPTAVAAVRAEDYYVRMMVAWYFATALAKQYDAVLPYLEEQKLDRWTHNKAIQKAIESNRINAAQKTCLRALKIK